MGRIPASPHSRFPSLILRAATTPPFPVLRSLPRTSLPKTRPIHLVELCGNIFAFLEAFLRNGYQVTRYTNYDKDLMARVATRLRLYLLHSRYPRLLPCTAFASWDTSLAHDVHATGERHWAALPVVDVIAFGPPCQPFSAAGPQRGWSSDTSQVFPAVLRHVYRVYLRHSKCMPSYILENVPAAANVPDISDSLGPPIIDRVEFHSSASRRSTAFWTNIVARTPI